MLKGVFWFLTCIFTDTDTEFLSSLSSHPVSGKLKLVDTINLDIRNFSGSLTEEKFNFLLLNELQFNMFSDMTCRAMSWNMPLQNL